MAMPKVLDWLDDLVAQVATNVTNIAKNASDIAANKAEFDTHSADDNRHWTETDRQNFDRTIHFKGYFVSTEKLEEAYPQGQLGDYAIVGGSDTVWLWDDETSSWLNSTEQGIVISVNGKTGEIVLSKTDVGLSNVDNTSDMNKPISTAQQAALDAKTDRRQITLVEAETVELRSGTYFIQSESVTILGTTATDWVVIVGEQASNQLSASQIWIPYTTAAQTRMFFRHQKYNNETNTNYWGEFVEVLTTLHLATLTNDINEIKTNIQTNATDITNLQLDKFDRINDDTLGMDAFNNTRTLRAGMYNVIGGSNRESVNTYISEQGYEFTNTMSNWSVLCFEQKYLKSGSYVYECISQIFFNLDEHRAFFRTKVSGKWNNFVELLSTNHLTLEDIERAKQYKGYFPQITDLRAAITSAIDGDYAIVGNALYIWDSRISSWVEVSGSGGGSGSTGTGKWSIKKYVANGVLGTLETPPIMKDLLGKELLNQIEIIDTNSWLVNETEDTVNRYYLTETYIEMVEKVIIEAEFNQAFMAGVSIYINDELIYSQCNSEAGIETIAFTFVKGWNKIQILGQSIENEAKCALSTKISENINCLRMDCYHADTPLTQAYVPLVGDSTIDGSVTVTETIGLTEKSYIQYNEYDNSISFMFNE